MDTFLHKTPFGITNSAANETQGEAAQWQEFITKENVLVILQKPRVDGGEICCTNSPPST